MLADPLFWLVAVVAVMLVGVSKGGFGGGLALAGVPIMALYMDPVTAAAILLPLLCAMDIMGVWAYWGRWHRATLALLLPAAVLGIALATLLFHRLDADGVRLLVGVIAVVFILSSWVGMVRVGERARPRRASGLFWGGMAGFTSFFAHAGGPPLAVYLLPQRLHRTVFQATTVVFFTIVNYVKLVPYAWLGQLHPGNLSISLALFPLAMLAMWLGVYLHHRVSDRLFYRLAYFFVLLTGVKLVYDGLAGLGWWPA